MIEFRDLHKKFGKLTVLDGIDLKISEGGIFAILGPNGSGKTTLIKCLLGMVIPDKGDITFKEKSVLGKWEYRNSLNYLPQIARFPSNLTVSELINMVRNIRPKESNVEELLNLFGLTSFLDKKVGNLSGGTMQKVNILLTFMFDSELIILDEPTNGLDPIALLNFKNLIMAEKAKGKTIFITTHIMSLVSEVADEIVFLLDGKIYFRGSIEALKIQTKNDNLEHAIANLISKQNA